MTQDIVEITSNDDKYIIVFLKHKQGVSKETLATEYGVSPRTIDNWLSKARALATARISGPNAKEFKADVYYDLRHIYELAEQSFISSGNPAFLKEMRGVQAQIANLLGLNAPPKSAQSDDSNEDNTNFMMILDESQYKDAQELAEKTVRDNPTIDGTITQVN